jgi:hypothetical protein
LTRLSWIPTALIAALAAAAPLRAQDTGHDAPDAEAPTPAPAYALLPEASFQLLAARYAPGEPDLRWSTWIGAGVSLARLANTTLFGTADIETVVGNERRGFDARQANYHLQLGARRPAGPWRLELYFGHVSRHESDREKEPAVDWNVLGLRAGRELDLGVPARVSLGLGHTTLASAVGYRLEATAGLEGDLARWNGGLAYLRGRARLVTVSREDSDLDRGGFADGSVEGGVRFERGPRGLELFVAWEHRNDVRLLEPGARDRALFGLRLSGGAPELLASQASGLGPRPARAAPDRD